MADVLDCQLIRVGGRTYRMHAPVPSYQAAGPPEPEHQEDAYLGQEDDYLECDAVEDAEARKQGDAWVAELKVDQELFPFIIGREGRRKKEIEEATGASLHIPKTPRGAGHSSSSSSQARERASVTITIRAADRAAVLKAKMRTELVILGAVNSRSLDYTHFVSIPLASPAVSARLQQFQEQVLSNPQAGQWRLHSSVFINPPTLHLTLVMLKLYSDEARSRAQKVLQQLRPAVQELLEGEPLRLRLAGLEIMNDDPSDVHVLYLKADLTSKEGRPSGQGRLEQLCRLVFQAYKEADLLVEGEREQVKIHATVINTRHRSASSQPAGPAEGHGSVAAATAATAAAAAAAAVAGGGPKGRSRHQHGERIGIDARALLADHGQLDVGTVVVQDLHLSQRGVYNEGGYYQSLSKLPLAD